MKLNFKSEKTGIDCSIDLDFKEVIDITKFIMENKVDLRILILESIDHAEEVFVKIVEKIKNLKELDKEVQEIIKCGMKETVVPVVKEVVKVEEQKEEEVVKEDIVEEKKSEVDPKDLAVILNGLISKL